LVCGADGTEKRAPARSACDPAFGAQDSSALHAVRYCPLLQSLRFWSGSTVHDISSLIRHHGLVIVCLSVLGEGLGLPVPSFAFVLVAAASLYESGDAPLIELGALAFLAGLAADVIWYAAGRRYGYRLLGTLCRISMSPDSCVQRTESIFMRWGSSTLVVARFVPGLSVVAQPLAGAIRQAWTSFLLYDSVGLILWTGSALALGVIFSSAVDDVLDTLSRYGTVGALLVLTALALYVAYKIARRHLYIRHLRMNRISVAELNQMIEDGNAPMILDVRPKEVQQAQGVIPGAIAVTRETLDGIPASPEGATEIVVYCACPNEASAVFIAKHLIDRGFRRVRPLDGGAEAWAAAGFALVATT
jgi:membrane protein DedA with SNARE-associated domain/rhodanese-related sulfurtransferase